MSDSAINGGSTVTAIRPGQRLEPSIDHVDPESDPGEAPTVSVLVVDDHTLLADSVMRAVRLEGFRAETVHPSSADSDPRQRLRRCSRRSRSSTSTSGARRSAASISSHR